MLVLWMATQDYIKKECAHSGSNIGYHLMHQRLTQKYKIHIEGLVMSMLCTLIIYVCMAGRNLWCMILSAVTDPIGIEQKS